MRRMITRAPKPDLPAHAGAPQVAFDCVPALIHASLALGPLDLFNGRRGVAARLQLNRSMLHFRLKKLGIFHSLKASLDESRYETIISPCSNLVENVAMRKRVLTVLLLTQSLALVWGVRTDAQDTSPEPYKFFHDYIGLNDDQIRNIGQGKAVAKILDAPSADQVFVFGAVYINSTPESYLKFALDIDALRKLPNYLEIRKFSNPAQLSDLEGFTLDEADIKDLKNCKPGHCEVQLPTDAMEEFQHSVNWSAPDAADQANHVAQELALKALLSYRQGGNAGLGTYRDKNHPAVVSETFASLLSRSKALPAYLPELHRYLLEYPNANSSNIESEFYWEKVNFGLKPTLRMVQAIVFHGKSPSEPAYAVAEKQLYASHYFETALDLTVCVKDAQHPNQPGFYLITMKGSQQAGLTGFKGSIVRKVAVDKTRASLEKALSSIKQKLESPATVAAR
jgi:hypothetical protein